MMQRIILIFMILLPTASLCGQTTDYTFSGEYDQVPFDSFVKTLEESSGLVFFYRPEWTSGVTITAKGAGLSLTNVLLQSLEPHGLTCYMDGGNNVFILPGTMIRMEDVIAADQVMEISEPEAEVPNETMKRKYFGREIEEVRTESVVIGRSTNAGQGSMVKLYGKIWNRESGEALLGATIYFPETETGIITDQYGQYQVVLSAGHHQISVHSLGMKVKQYNLAIYADGRLDVEMENEIIPLNEVVISADRYQNVSGIQMGYSRLDIQSIKEIPLVMGEKDLIRVAQLLPGVQSVGEGSSGLNVRGSSADENMFYIDRIPVYNTSHLFGFFSAFSPDIINEFNLYKSNIPVEYGGRIASVFNVSTREGNKNQFTARGGISPITGHMAVEGPLKKEKHSFVLSARSSYSDWILKFLEDPSLRNSKASFYDLSAAVTIDPNESNLIKFFGYYSSDHFKYSDVLSYDYQNTGASVTWRRRISSSLSSDMAAVFSHYSFGIVNQEYPSSAYSHDYRIGQGELVSDFKWVPVRNHLITFGGKLIYYHLDRGEIAPFGDQSVRTSTLLGMDNGIESAIYLGDKYEVLPGITLYGGIRYSLFNNLGPAEIFTYSANAPPNSENITDTLTFGPGAAAKSYSGPDLRFAANLRTGPSSSVKLSYNRTRQYLFMLTNTIAIAPTDQWKLCDYHISPPYGDQFSAGFFKDFPGKGIQASAEVYLKKIHHIVEYKQSADIIGSQHIEQDILQGKQDAYGIELMLEKASGQLNGWVSYTFSRSEITVDGAFPWQRINSGEPYPANYDKPHALNLVMNYRVNRRLSLSGNVVYNTGRPVTYPVSSYYLRGQEIVNYSQRNAYRLPDYFRIDLSLNLEGNLKARKKIHSYWMVNIYNLTGRKNAYSVYFRSEGGQLNSYRLAIFGTAIVSLSWNFKFGNYASQ
jgi:hypothetical protein